MNTKKKLGICMDHAMAHIIDFPSELSAENVIITSSTHQEDAHSHDRNENANHNKEQHQHAEYYKRIGAVIRNYDEVLLFGPTTAKAELVNILKTDHLFENIQIEIKQTDRMTDNQQHAFVKDHFSKIHAS